MVSSLEQQCALGGKGEAGLMNDMGEETGHRERGVGCCSGSLCRAPACRSYVCGSIDNCHHLKYVMRWLAAILLVLSVNCWCFVPICNKTPNAQYLFL